MSLTKSQSNRINAKKSTGPKTPAGKSAIKLNALKLGIYTKDVVLPSEDPIPYRELQAAFLLEYSPETPTEIYLIDNIVTAIWRRRRVQAAEIGLHDLLRCEQSAGLRKRFTDVNASAEMANAMRADFTASRMLSDLWRHDARLERSITRSLKELQRHKDNRPIEPEQSGPKTGPITNQKQQEQSQTTSTTPESTTSNDQPIQAATLRATATAFSAFPNTPQPNAPISTSYQNPPLHLVEI